MSARRFWTDAEIEAVRAGYPDAVTAALASQLGRSVSSVYQLAQKLGLHKSQAFLDSPASGRTTGRQGIGTRFEAGHVPANKGLRRPGWAPGRMSSTHFKKGGRTGRANEVYKPVGTERISKDGYLERKINDAMPFNKRWRAVHILTWEAANGALPKGYAVTFKNKDRTDTRLENLELTSRADLARRNSIHKLPPELKRAIMSLGQFKRRVREEQNRRSA